MNGLNVWNIVLQEKYKIRLEHGKEGMSFTYKSFTSKLLHHQSIVASLVFQDSTLQLEFMIKQRFP
jgi:hypothetical protein